MIYVIDYNNVHRRFAGFETQAELLFDCCENRWRGADLRCVCVCGQVCGGRVPVERVVEFASQAGFVDDRAASGVRERTNEHADGGCESLEVTPSLFFV